MDNPVYSRGGTTVTANMFVSSSDQGCYQHGHRVDLQYMMYTGRTLLPTKKIFSQIDGRKFEIFENNFVAV